MRMWIVGLAFLKVSTAAAQEWNDPATRHLVRRAIAERAVAAADSTLVSYRARAHGVVLFLAEIGFVVGMPPRVLKADELDVEVYWERPDRSKQVIRAWRDSTFFPVDLAYHRDHLGIVSNDFGPMIRIGEGDEVADVVHPLAPRGPALYDYRITDTVAIAGPAGRVVVAALEFRPKDRRQPLAVGTLDLDLARAQVVRSSLSFTPAAYRDADLEDIAVRLERSLVEGRYWLPYAQEIEIRRRSAAVDFPVRGIIRGRWQIDDVQLNDSAVVVAWAGPAIGGLTRPGGGPWTGPMLRPVDSAASWRAEQVLGEVRAAAGRALGRRLVSGLPAWRLSVTRVSDILRINRVEGLRIGAGLAWQTESVGRVALTGGVATIDGRVTGRIEIARSIGGLPIRVAAERSVVDMADSPAASTLVNSLAAQEAGRDWGDYLLRDRIGIETAFQIGLTTRLVAEIGRDWAGSLEAVARPARGTYRANPALGGPPYSFGHLTVSSSRFGATGLGYSLGARGEIGTGSGDFGRLTARGRWAARVAGGTLDLTASAGIGTPELPRRRSFVLGGPGTLPGEAFRGFGGRRMVLVAADWLVVVPGPSIPLGPFGRTAPRMAIGPIVAVGSAGGPVAGVPWVGSRGLRPILGMALEAFERVLRLEVGRGLRAQSGWSVSIDLTRSWWPII